MMIVTKPVKCGDCNIICGESQKLLIDCGSSNQGNGLNSQEFAFSKIKDEIDKNEITDILITHFDKDHFNGVLELPDTYRLDNVYLPYSIIEGETIYTKSIGRLFAIASSDSWGFKLSTKILDLFKKLENLSANIRFVKKNDTIPFEGDKIRVLWPEVVASTFSYGDIPVKLNNEFTEDHSQGYYSYETDEQVISWANIEESLDETFNKMVGEDNYILAEAMQVFVKCFNNYLHIRHSGESADFLPVEEAYNSLNEQRIRFRERLDNDRLEKIKNFTRQQYHSLVTSMNAISIVCDFEDRFIFLGDAPTRVIDYIEPFLNSQYEFVKIQHHGTKAYFTNKTLIGNNILISNGGFKNRKVSEKNINASKIICTDAHKQPSDFCEYYIINKICAPNCIKVSTWLNTNV